MIVSMNCSQHLIEGNGSETCCGIGDTIRKDQFAVMDESSARVDDIGNVACSFVLIWFEKRFAESSNHPGGIIAIEEERTDAVFPYRPDAVAEDQPPGIGLDR